MSETTQYLLLVLNVIGVLLKAAVLLYAFKLYYERVHKPLWEACKTKCEGSCVVFGSTIMFLAVAFVAAQVLAAGLKEWGGELFIVGGIFVWAGQALELPLQVLVLLVQLPLVWLQAISGWLAGMGDLIQILVWPVAVVFIACFARDAVKNVWGPKGGPAA